MSLPEAHMDVRITLVLTEGQARDVMDDLLKTDAPTPTGEGFSSDGSEAVYKALAALIGSRLL